MPIALRILRPIQNPNPQFPMSSDSDFASFPSVHDSDRHQIDGGIDTSSSSSPAAAAAAMESKRLWRDVFWLCVFVLHLLAIGFVLGLLGLNRFKKPDRLNIDRFTNMTTVVGGDRFAN